MCSTLPATEEIRFISSEAGNQTTEAGTGCNADGLVASALSKALGGVFWQQPLDSDICICPHWLFIMRQQVRSSVVICAAGAIQAIAGLSDDASSKTNIPSWRSALIGLSSIPELRDQIPMGATLQMAVSSHFAP